jgi:hypothetical protein
VVCAFILGSYSTDSRKNKRLCLVHVSIKRNPFILRTLLPVLIPGFTAAIHCKKTVLPSSTRKIKESSLISAKSQ